MKEKKENNTVNHIMAGETRFRIESPFDSKEDDSQNEIKFHWDPKNVPGESQPHMRGPQAWMGYEFEK